MRLLADGMDAAMRSNAGFRLPIVGAASKRLALLLGFCLVGLLGEGLLRAFFPHLAPRTAAIAQFWRYDPSLGWSHIPNAKGLFKAFGSRTSVSINSNGFRDQERSYDRDQSRYRIVALGDSMVWGYGVEQERVFTAVLERRRPGLEVINLGVSGYGTDQELILLHQEAWRYRPDLIMLVFVENDFQTNVRRSVYLVYQKPVFEFSTDGALRLTNTPVPRPQAWQRAASALVRHSFLGNLFASAYYRFTVKRRPASLDAGASGERRPFPQDAEERITAALLLEIQRTAQRAGSEFLLVLDRMGLRGDEREDFFRSRNVRVLNLNSVFPEGETKELYLPDGVHWSALGHEKVADRLLKYLEDEHLIQRSGQRYLSWSSSASWLED